MGPKKRVGVLALAMAATSLLAAEPAMDAPASKAMREKMAQVHADMAQCLRSDKPMGECQAAMRAAHESVMGKGMGMKKGCGMMDKPSDAAAAASHWH